MRLIELKDIPGSENIRDGETAAWFDFDRFSHIGRWDYYDETSVNLSFGTDTVCFLFEDKADADKFIKGVLDIVRGNAQ